MSSVNQVLVERLLRGYFNEVSFNMNLFFAGEMDVMELQEQFLLLDSIYAQKILNETGIIQL